MPLASKMGSIPRRLSSINLRRQPAGSAGKQKKSSKRPWGVLSGETTSGIKYGVVWTAYLLLGAWLFLVFERSTEDQWVWLGDWRRYREIMEGFQHPLVSHTDDPLEKNHTELRELREKLYAVCPHPHLDQAGTHGNENSSGTAHAHVPSSQLAILEEHCADALRVITVVTSEAKCSFVDAIYYTMTLVTTIGYGHIYPATRVGRLFAVLYAMVGVPLTCILMAKNSNILSIKMLQVYERLKVRYDQPNKNSKTLLYLVTWLYLSIGFIIFMFVPSVAFVYIEGWTYDQSLYYTFITLTTIGFGEMVGGYGNSGPYSDCYKIAIVVWIMIALGYWVMLLTFLQKALKRKIVPKRIRVQFRAKQLAKQAEFLRQLMTKVREQSSEDQQPCGGDQTGSLHRGAEEPRNSMSLMAEALGGDAHGRNGLMPTNTFTVKEGALRSLWAQRSQHTTISLADLLVADVVVRTPKITLLKNLIDQSIHTSGSSEETPKTEDSETEPGGLRLLKDGNVQTNEGRTQQNGKMVESREVTLPLKDVLGLVTLVATLEGQIAGNTILDDQSIYSTIHSMVSMDAQLPHLREAFMNVQSKKYKPPTRPSMNHSMSWSDSEHEVENHPKGGIHTSKSSVVLGNVGRKFQRRGSCLDAFLDSQTKREYVEVGQESQYGDKHDSIADELDTEVIVVPDDDDDTCNGDDTVLSLDDDDDDSGEHNHGDDEDVEFLEADDGSGHVADSHNQMEKGSAHRMD